MSFNTLQRIYWAQDVLIFKMRSCSPRILVLQFKLFGNLDRLDLDTCAIQKLSVSFQVSIVFILAVFIRHIHFWLIELFLHTRFRCALVWFFEVNLPFVSFGFELTAFVAAACLWTARGSALSRLLSCPANIRTGVLHGTWALARPILLILGCEPLCPGFHGFVELYCATLLKRVVMQLMNPWWVLILWLWLLTLRSFFTTVTTLSIFRGSSNFPLSLVSDMRRSLISNTSTSSMLRIILIAWVCFRLRVIKATVSVFAAVVYPEVAATKTQDHEKDYKDESIHL